MARILIVEDEPSTLNVLSTLLKAEGYEVTPVSQGDEAAKLIAAQPFDLMLSDIRMTPLDGMELLKQVRAQQPKTAVIMLTGYGTVETAVESLKLGAFDYITKPFKVDELFITVQKALEAGAARAADAGGGQQVEHYRFDNIVAASESMRKVCEMIERVAQTEVMVLICGEDGVGKSLIARTVHAVSKRRDGPFVQINCTEMTEAILIQKLIGPPAGGGGGTQPGAFEQARGGTLYIDGIHTMPLNAQDLLLKALQAKKVERIGAAAIPVDIRLVTSTNADLDALVDEGQMREDLYYRLSALPIEVKPLRDRPDDILPLVFHSLRLFIGEGKTPPTVTPEACAILEQYRWPGNVRELENVIKHSLAFAKGALGKEALPPAILTALRNSGQRVVRKTNEADAYRAKALKAFLREKEKNYLVQILASVNGNKDEAATKLKISSAALAKKLELHGL